MEALSGKVFLLITGASQGIGRQIAVSFSQQLEKGSRVLLLARNQQGLKETADNIANHVSAQYVGVDLSVANADQLTEIINKHAKPSEFDRAIVVHNVGSTGDLTKSTADMVDFDVWRKYYDLNVFSPAVLNSVFMKIFKDIPNKVVINISSLFAIQPTKSAAYYCSGKAARDMYFKIFAEEYPAVNVINYAPGPVETEMLRTFTNTVADPEVKNTLTTMRQESKQLTTEQTVNRLLEVLKLRKYKSGDHVDYYDDI